MAPARLRCALPLVSSFLSRVAPWDGSTRLVPIESCQSIGFASRIQFRTSTALRLVLQKFAAVSPSWPDLGDFGASGDFSGANAEANRNVYTIRYDTIRPRVYMSSVPLPGCLVLERGRRPSCTQLRALLGGGCGVVFGATTRSLAQNRSNSFTFTSIRYQSSAVTLLDVPTEGKYSFEGTWNPGKDDPAALSAFLEDFAQARRVGHSFREDMSHFFLLQLQMLNLLRLFAPAIPSVYPCAGQARAVREEPACP